MTDARILVVDDESDIRELLDEILSEEGYQVTTAEDAEHARAARRSQSYDLTLLDIWMPDADGISLLKEWSESGSLGPVVMMSGHGTVDTAVEATRLGALDFIEKPLSLSKLLRTVKKALSHKRSREGRRTLVESTAAPIGKSKKIRSLREELTRVAAHDTHTLLSGEPGSGRETFARYLAARSARSNGPFVVLGGAELEDPGSQASSDTDSAIARAQGGILYVNALGDLSPVAQQRLLSMLDTASQPPDVRILGSAAPGFDHTEAFRSELLSRLNLVVIRVPPLREYAEDVPELLRYYADVLVDAEQLPFRRFTVAAQNRLRNYPWPGNLSELKNVVKRLLVLGGEEEVSLADVEAELSATSPENEPLVKQDLLALPLREAREHFERAYLQQQLILCGGKVGQLAKRVGMERTHLYRKLRSLGVDFRQTLTED